MKQAQRESALTRLLRRTRLQSRLLATCLLLSLIPVLVVGFFAYSVYTRSINRSLGQSAEQAVRLLNATVVSELGKFSAYIDAISVSESVQNTLALPKEARNLADVTLAIKQRMQEVPAQLRYLRNISVIDRAGNVLYDLGFGDIQSEQFSGLLARVDSASPDDSLQYVRTFHGMDTLVLGRKIFKFAKGDTHIGYILIYMREALLSESVFRDIDFGAGSNILLMDGRGHVLSSRDKTLLGSMQTETGGLLEAVQDAREAGRMAVNIKTPTGGQLVVFAYDASLDVYFIATIPESVITAETRRITASLVVVAAVTVLFSLLLAIAIYRSIVGPIRRAMGFCEEATANKIAHHMEDKSADELGYLARAIDQFVHEIQRLLHKSKQDERRKRMLELEMLAYQINPHFLFNTLNTLKWVAMLNEVPVLEEGISSLSCLLQSTLLRSEESITVHEELDNVRHYVSIQKIRYADCFQMEYQVDPALLNAHVPRFILQPLVENAILHGTREDGASIRITIGCTRLPSGDILLTVEDDGQGFEAIDIQKKGKERFSGIGLTNVHERIRLSFGEPYGLLIDSVPGQGTRCQITLRDTADAQKEDTHA